MKEFMLFCIMCCCFSMCQTMNEIEEEIQSNNKIMQEKAQGLTDALIRMKNDTTRSN